MESQGVGRKGGDESKVLGQCKFHLLHTNLGLSWILYNINECFEEDPVSRSYIAFRAGIESRQVTLLSLSLTAVFPISVTNCVSVYLPISTTGKKYAIKDGVVRSQIPQSSQSESSRTLSVTGTPTYTRDRSLERLTSHACMVEWLIGASQARPIRLIR
jgi:hypothetical protein